MTLSSFVRIHGLLALAALIGCTPSSAPETGDSNTSWLRGCMHDRECGGTGRCIAQVCSLACSTESGDNPCGTVSASAICDQPTGTDQARCDLLCDTNTACSALGPGLTCLNGHCRDAALDAGMPLVTSFDAGAEDAAPDPTGEAGPDTALAFLTDSPDLTVRDFTLADAWRSSGTGSRWVNDHWRVAYRGERTVGDQGPDTRYAVHVLDVYLDGRTGPVQTTLEAPLLSAEGAPVSMYVAQRIGPDGSVAELMTPWRGAVLTELQAGELRFYLPGEARAHSLAYDEVHAVLDFAPVAQSADWLVLSLLGTQQEVALGRYRPAEDRWITPPTALFSGFALPASISLHARGDDALVRWAYEQTRFGSIPGAAAPEPMPLSPLSAWTTVSLGDDVLQWNWDDDFVYYQQGTPNLRNERWQIARLPADPPITPIAQFEAPQEDFPADPSSTSTIIMAIAMLAVMDAQLVGVCHVRYRFQGDIGTNAGALFFSVYAADGSRRLGPVLLGSDDSVIGGCGLSWSGSAFLVTWHGDSATDPVNPHARIIHVP